MNEFIQRLKQRKLVQWALAYVAFWFALLQGIDIVASRFNWPDAIERYLILALAIGFFVTLVLAWYHGERGAQRVGGSELLIIALLLAIGGALIWRFGPVAVNRARALATQPAPAGAIAKSAAAASVTYRAATAIAAQPIPAKSIAVLPFENLSTDKGNAYFADGMQDLILTKLADIGDLKVISRTSTMKYASHPDDLKTVGQQLGVATILEGSVQKAGNQVLINVQLIDAQTDGHIWAESYTRTLDNIFGVEGEVAEKVATTLNAKLTQTESASVASIPTQNPAAYDAYLRGLMIEKNLDTSASKHPLRDAEGFYAQAVKLDPSFALAWAHLSYIKTRIYSEFIDRDPAGPARAKQAVDTALQLRPDLGEGYLALAQYYYLSVRDLDAAIPPLNKARKLLPNNADVLVALADVEERQGKWQEANANLRQAAVLEPRTVGWLTDLAENYEGIREFAQAHAILDRALVLAPSDKNLIADQARVWLDQGNSDEAQKLLDGLPATSARLVRVRQALYRRDFNAAVVVIKQALAQPDVNAIFRPVWASYLAYVLDMAGRHDEARALASPLVNQLESQRKSPADDVLLAGFLARTHAILGNKDAALREARRDVFIHSTCSVCKPDAVAEMAQIQARFGDLDAAMEIVPQLLIVPNGFTVAELRLDPRWDPLRKDPRFEALLKKYTNDGAANDAPDSKVAAHD